MSKSSLSQKTLKKHLEYDPETGLFTWLVRRGSAQAGDAANCLDTTGYIRISLYGFLYQAHRLSFLYMEGALPPDAVDHINHKKDDNRWSNLRHSNKTINARNLGMRSTNTSGHTGVVFMKATGQWKAQIRRGRKNFHLGLFDDINDAVAARKQGNIKYGFHPNHGK